MQLRQEVVRRENTQIRSCETLVTEHQISDTLYDYLCIFSTVVVLEIVDKWIMVKPSADSWVLVLKDIWNTIVNSQLSHTTNRCKNQKGSSTVAVGNPLIF